MDAVANRVRRVATGWETELTVAVDGVISRQTLFELAESFYALRPDAQNGPATRLRLRTEVMAGLWEALAAGHADLAIGLGQGLPSHPEIQTRPLGEIDFVFAVAPHHAPIPRSPADDDDDDEYGESRQKSSLLYLHREPQGC